MLDESDSPAPLPTVSPAYPPAIAWLEDGVVIGIVGADAGPSAEETVLANPVAMLNFMTVIAQPKLDTLTDAASLSEKELGEYKFDGDELLIGKKSHRTVISASLANTRITPELLTTLRESGAKRARIKEFSIARWDIAWLMGLSCLGLVIAASMVKIATKKEIAAELAAPSDAENSPTKSLERVVSTVACLINDAQAATDDEARNAMIIERVGNLQRDELTTLSESRTILVARLNLTGYAQYMDRFSAMERQLNRAWSAAADGVTEESVICLNAANALMPDVVTAMKDT